jgi:hypothetical protein
VFGVGPSRGEGPLNLGIAYGSTAGGSSEPLDSLNSAFLRIEGFTLPPSNFWRFCFSGNEQETCLDFDAEAREVKRLLFSVPSPGTYEIRGFGDGLWGFFQTKDGSPDFTVSSNSFFISDVKWVPVGSPSPIAPEAAMGTVTVSDLASETISHDASGTISDRASETISKEASETISNEASKTISKEASETISKEASETISDLASETLSNDASETVSNEASETISDLASETISNDASETLSDLASETLSNEASETISNEASETLSNEASETISNEASETISNDGEVIALEGSSFALPDPNNSTRSPHLAQSSHDFFERYH